MVVSIPDAFEGESRHVVVELNMPAASSGGPVLRTQAAYWATCQPDVPLQSPLVVLEVGRSEEPEQEPDEEVTQQRDRVQVADALENAIACGEEGNLEEARRVLEEQARKLLSKHRQTDASAALLSEIQDAKQRLSSASA